MVDSGEEKLLLTVTETGYGRLSAFSDYRVQSRGGKGLTNYHVDRYGEVAGILAVDTTEDVILISNDGIIIRMPIEQIRQCRRPSKGVRVMRLEGEAKIVSMAQAAHEASEITAAPIDEGDADEESPETTEE